MGSVTGAAIAMKDRALAAEERARKNEEDAGRYRNLRDVDPDAELPTVYIHRQDSWGNWRYYHIGMDQLDAAIDAARGSKP